MDRYVCGFLFTECFTWVVLIRKNRPEWQAGLLNGVGGRIEDGETPTQAMRREFREEAELDVEGWEPFCLLSGGAREVHFFKAVGEPHTVGSMTDEEVTIACPHTFDGWVPSLRWVLPMAMVGGFYAVTDVPGAREASQ